MFGVVLLDLVLLIDNVVFDGDLVYNLDYCVIVGSVATMNLVSYYRCFVFVADTTRLLCRNLLQVQVQYAACLRDRLQIRCK